MHAKAVSDNVIYNYDIMYCDFVTMNFLVAVNYITLLSFFPVSQYILVHDDCHCV